MGNDITGVDLKGKRVVLDPKIVGAGVQEGLGYIFRCDSGFGCNPNCSGQAVFGEFEVDQEATRINRGDILRLATEDERDYGEVKR